MTDFVTTVTVRITPLELANLFVRMVSSDQAEFFNHAGELTASWLPIQLAYISSDIALSQEGRDFMRMVGEYSEVNNNEQD